MLHKGYIDVFIFQCKFTSSYYEVLRCWGERNENIWNSCL